MLGVTARASLLEPPLPTFRAGELATCSHPPAANCFLCPAFTRPFLSSLHLVCSYLEQRCSW